MMGESADEKTVPHAASLLQDRREFLRDFLRYLILGGLVFTTGAAITKRISASPDEKCINFDICRGCRIFKDCDLPLAVSVKQGVAG